MEDLDLQSGLAIVGGVYVGSALLHVVVPSSLTDGYACDRYGKTLKYRLNGLWVMLIMVAIWWALGFAGIVPWELIAEKWKENLFVANIIGLIGSVMFYVKGLMLPRDLKEPYSRCATRDRGGERPKPTAQDLETNANRGFLGHFFLGQEFNPRIGKYFDVKMFLYLVGAVMLALNLVSGVALQRKLDQGSLSRASIVVLWTLGWFVTEYMYFEEIHLYTYDLFAEKLGFKLFWGCTCFYPFFYSLAPMYNVIYHEAFVDLSIEASIACVILFYLGWVFTRGPNLQKFYFKIDPKRETCFNGLIKQETIPGSRILVSGFWGLSRHVNYLGETVQAFAIALPGFVVTGSPISFAYPIYYIGLFVPRQIDDDRICAGKYGAKWTEYENKVPYRIIPFIY